MSLVEARERRERLRNPANAVPDVPIDLKRRVPAFGQVPITLRVPVAVTPYVVPRRYPSLEDITRVVCDVYNVTSMDLESDRRQKTIVRPRQVWCYLARTMTPTSFPVIGRYLGGRDHSTAMYAYNKMRGLVLTDTLVGIEVGAVQRRIEALFSSRNNHTCFDAREI